MAVKKATVLLDRSQRSIGFAARASGVVFITVLNRCKALGTAERNGITQDELQNMMAGGQELADWNPRWAARCELLTGQR